MDRLGKHGSFQPFNRGSPRGTQPEFAKRVCPVAIHRRVMHKPTEAGKTAAGKLGNWLHEFLIGDGHA